MGLAWQRSRIRNFIERSVILTRGRVLEVPLSDLQAFTASHDEFGDAVTEAENSRSNTIRGADDYAKEQREEIVHALTESRGRVGGANGAAARLSVNRTTLLSRMKRFGIDRREFGGFRTAASSIGT